MPQEVDKCRCKSYNQHLPRNERGFINMNLDIKDGITRIIDQVDNVGIILGEVETVLQSLQQLRDELSEEAYDELDETPVGNLLNSLADLEYEVEKLGK